MRFSLALGSPTLMDAGQWTCGEGRQACAGRSFQTRGKGRTETLINRWNDLSVLRSVRSWSSVSKIKRKSLCENKKVSTDQCFLDVCTINELKQCWKCCEMEATEVYTLLSALPFSHYWLKKYTIVCMTVSCCQCCGCLEPFGIVRK